MNNFEIKTRKFLSLVCIFGAVGGAYLFANGGDNIQLMAALALATLAFYIFDGTMMLQRLKNTEEVAHFTKDSFLMSAQALSDDIDTWTADFRSIKGRIDKLESSNKNESQNIHLIEEDIEMMSEQMERIEDMVGWFDYRQELLKQAAAVHEGMYYMTEAKNEEMKALIVPILDNIIKKGKAAVKMGEGDDVQRIEVNLTDLDPDELEEVKENAKKEFIEKEEDLAQNLRDLLDEEFGKKDDENDES